MTSGMHYGYVERTDVLRGLLTRFREDRDAAAMEELVRRTRTKLLRIARRIGAPQDAEDSVQAAYHALLGRPEAPDAPTLPWLITAVIRIAYRRKAIAARESGIAEQLARPKPPPSPAESAARAETSTRIRAAVESLPEKYRNPLVLYYLEALGAAETARLLDIPPSTLRTRLERGRNLLRSRIGPVTTYGLMFVPWLLLDGGRAFAGAGAASIGGVVQAKTVITVTGIALAAGTLGVFVGATTASGSGDAPAARADRSARQEIADLHDQVAERDEMILAMRQRVDPGTGAPLSSSGEGAGGGTGGKAGSPMPKFQIQAFERRSVSIDSARAQTAAQELGVSQEELEIAQRAFENAENLSDPAAQRAATEALQALGERRTRAMVALVRGLDTKGIGTGGMRKALEAAHVEGQEQLLIDLIKDGTTPRATKEDVLRNIEPFDSPVVRNYLLARLAVETDQYFFTTILLALGRLGEQRVAPEIRRMLQRDSQWLPFHFYGIFTLGNVGGPEAEAVLLDYLRSGTSANLDRAVTALAKLNPGAARSEAQTILARPDASKLSSKTLEALRQQAR